MRVLLCLFFVLQLPNVGVAQDSAPRSEFCSAGAFGPKQCIRMDQFAADTCKAIEYFGERHGLDTGFFARLLWQESRFDPNAVSPANAHGIAQFIPSTAKLRGLKDPFNPAEAIEHAAEYLGEMTRKYGNLGLAAVGYNGGEGRAEGLIAKTGGLARETREYVHIITGISPETWRDDPPQNHDFRLQDDTPFQDACEDMALQRKYSKFPNLRPQFKAWGVQVAFGTSVSGALLQFENKTRTCSQPIQGEHPEMIWQKSRASPKGGYYLARIGRDTRYAADDLCRKLRSNGCICAVYKNP